MFNERLRALRNKIGISQKELSKSMFVSQQTIAKWELGTATPNPDMINRLADFFEVTADYLLGRDEIPVALSRPGGYDDLSEEEKAQIDGLIDMILKRKEK